MVRILFITSTRIGDAVLSTGLLDHLLREHPEARITVACGPVAEGVFTRMPGLERIIPLAKKRWSLHWLELWWQVAFRRWDLVVDLRGSAIAWLLWARRRAVMKGGRRPGHRLLHIAETLGVTPAPRPVAWFDAADAARAAALLPGGPWLILGPTANWRVKMWPAERFIALAQKLTAPGGLLPGAGIAYPLSYQNARASVLAVVNTSGTTLPSGRLMIALSRLASTASTAAITAAFLSSSLIPAVIVHIAA